MEELGEVVFYGTGYEEGAPLTVREQLLEYERAWDDEGVARLSAYQDREDSEIGFAPPFRGAVPPLLWPLMPRVAMTARRTG